MRKQQSSSSSSSSSIENNTKRSGRLIVRHRNGNVERYKIHKYTVAVGCLTSALLADDDGHLNGKRSKKENIISCILNNEISYGVLLAVDDDAIRLLKFCFLFYFL